MSLSRHMSCQRGIQILCETAKLKKSCDLAGLGRSEAPFRVRGGAKDPGGMSGQPPKQRKSGHSNIDTKGQGLKNSK
jgi:hypothetical protein